MAAAENSQLKTSFQKTPTNVVTRWEGLSNDMAWLFHTGLLSDAVVTDGTEEFRVHAVILSMRSPVFDKMLQHQMKENLEKRIVVKDISVEVLRELIQYMYDGIVRIKDWSMARDLYVAADFYEVRELKRVCSSRLSFMDLNNVIDTLLFADLHSDAGLKKASFNFIFGYYSYLKDRQDWKNLLKTHRTLAIEALSFVIDRNIMKNSCLW